MWKRNHVEAVPCPLNAKPATDYFLQLRALDELRDSQSTDWNNEARPQNFDFIIHPRRAVANLVRSWNTICAARILSGKTPADCREINFRSNSGFIHPAEFLEPVEKRLAGGMRERSLQDRFPRPGRLTNDHYIAQNCAAGDRRRFHARAATALKQSRHMLIELSLNSFCSHGLWAVRTWSDNVQGRTGSKAVATAPQIVGPLKPPSGGRLITASSREC